MKAVSDVYLNSDDYPREGCRIEVYAEATADGLRYMVSAFAPKGVLPNGRAIDRFPVCSAEEVGAVVASWLQGGPMAVPAAGATAVESYSSDSLSSVSYSSRESTE